MRAAFAELDASPRYFPIRKYGGLHRTVYAERMLDPLYVKAAVFHDGERKIAFISVDVVILEWEQVSAIRRGVGEACGIPPDCVLVCATHNHSCPAVITRPVFEREEEYLSFLRRQAVEAVRRADAALEPVEVGIESAFEGRISFNRRYIMKDGSVKTHPKPGSPQMRHAEGVIDPEVGVVAVRGADGRLRGVLVNFGCHATHHMGGDVLSAGFPGAMYRHVRQRFGEDCACVFLNGACGNVHHSNPLDPTYVDDLDRMGALLAGDVDEALGGMQFSGDLPVSGSTRDIRLPMRDFSALEADLDRPGFLEPLLASRKVYEDSLRILREKWDAGGYEDAQVQVLRLGKSAFVAIPAEYFMEHGLRIKMHSPVTPTFVVSLANGWVGYVPTMAAFQRTGGHESTSALWSKLVPEAGDMLADTALELLGETVG